MNFAYRDGIIYLHSGPEGGKVTMAEHHPRVCITFCEGHELVYMHRQVACSYSMKSRSVMCHGNVRFIEDMDEKRRILDIIMQQYVDYEFRERTCRAQCENMGDQGRQDDLQILRAST